MNTNQIIDSHINHIASILGGRFVGNSIPTNAPAIILEQKEIKFPEKDISITTLNPIKS